MLAFEHFLLRPCWGQLALCFHWVLVNFLIAQMNLNPTAPESSLPSSCYLRSQAFWGLNLGSATFWLWHWARCLNFLNPNFFTHKVGDTMFTKQYRDNSLQLWLLSSLLLYFHSNSWFLILLDPEPSTPLHWDDLPVSIHQVSDPDVSPKLSIPVSIRVPGPPCPHTGWTDHRDSWFFA